MMRILAAFLFVATLAGCQGSSVDPTQAGSSAHHAECLVCKCNADLACVDVVVDQNTPEYTYEGKEYYFCSEACRNKFAAKPAKYVAK
jgi:YHS domain-containing protein